MQKIVLILISMTLAFCVQNVSAQQKTAPMLSEIEKVKAELFSDVSAGPKSEVYIPQWQDDFDKMRFKSSNEVARNLKLSIEQKDLQKQIEQLRREYEKAQVKNKELQDKVRERRELADEKAWKAKVDAQEQRFKNELALKDQELQRSRKDVQLLEDKIDVIRLKLKLMGVQDLSDQRFALQQERNLLEAQILGNQEKERDLKAKIDGIKSGGMKLDPEVARVKADIDSSRKLLKQLQEEEGALNGTSGPSLSEKIEILKRQKADILKESEKVKAQIMKYKNSRKMGIANQRIKELVEAISAVDAANNELNEEITYLTENIAILKVRIKKLEYKAESINALKGKKKETVR